MANKKSNDTGDGDKTEQPEAAPDLNALAKEYLDLWQQQLAETARDGTLAKTMSDAVRLMSAGAAQIAANMPQPAGMDTDGVTSGASTDHSQPDTDTSTSGAAAAGAAHRDDDGVLDELNRRIAELEERVRILERRVPKKSHGPR